jgi:uncharacterized protein YprB with RNaseH-like and TPR domain
MSDQDLRRRLSKMGVKKPRTKSDQAASDPIRHSFNGHEIDTPNGPALVIEKTFPLQHVHGKSRILSLQNMDAELAADVARDPGLREAMLADLRFLDTETTGLVGGAGTVAFLVGIGRFIDDGFRIRQYFLRDPSEERAMLRALEEELDSGTGFVTYNGRSFDLPLLEMRYVLSLRKRWALTTWPQFDLLHPARRLWKRSLPDCSLGTIEREILGVVRSEKDVPGEQIPGMYVDYLRTGDPSAMERVIYHNEIDILSLVNLCAEILNKHLGEKDASVTPAEALGIARWHEKEGRAGSAEEHYLLAMTSIDENIRVEALRHYTIYLKRANKRDQALERWAAWHELSPEDPRPCIELAKFYEWHQRDLEQAKSWAQESMVCLSHQPKDWRREILWGEIEHRLRRLERKIISK